MTRVAVTKGTLKIPPTYFAVQHTQRLIAENPESFTVRTFTMALQLEDPAVRQSGLDIVEVAVLPGTSFRQRELTMPLSFGRMTRAIVDFAPDVIHQHFATWSNPAVRASQRTGAPLLVTLHGADVFASLRSPNAVALQGRPMLAWHHTSVALAFAHASRVLPVSRYLADRAIEAGARPDSVEVHYQGIDTDYFTPGAAPRPDVHEVIFVGALSRAKGVLDLVQASIAVLSAHPHRLVLVGEGPLRQTLREAAREHPHLDVVGPLLRDEVRDHLRRAHLLVLPTQANHGAREAAGLALLEAQACGVPVITYDSGGAPEMLDPGRTGLVVAEGDRAALSDAIAQVLRLSSADYAHMQSHARDWVLKHRSLAESARQLSDLYAGL